MTADELVTQARTELFDEVIGYDDEDELWDNPTLLRYVNQAQNEFAEMTLCFPDNISFTNSIVAGTAEYDLDNRIIEVLGGYLSTAKKRVLIRGFNDFERGQLLNSPTVVAHGNWEGRSGLPRFIIPDLQVGKLVLWPKPVASDTLTLYTYRFPLHEITSLTDTITVESQFQSGLLYKIKSLALAKLDADSANLEQSMLFGQKWESFIQDASAVFARRFKRNIMEQTGGKKK